MQDARNKGRLDALATFKVAQYIGGPIGGRVALPAAAAAAAPVASAASRFKMPGTLALAGLGALGAGLYGAHRAQPDQSRNLVYAPMEGGFQ